MSTETKKVATLNEISFDIAKWDRQCKAAEPYIKQLGELFAHITQKYEVSTKIANPNNLASILYQLAGKAAIGEQEPVPAPPADTTPTTTKLPRKLREIKKA